MYFELAEKLGYTVDELLENISSEELSEWRIVWELRYEEEIERQRERDQLRQG